MTTEIYSGYGWGKTHIGSCEDGNIYSGYGWSKTQIGCYKDGNVYSGYGWGKTQVGSYKDGEVYSGYGWGKSQVECYKDGHGFCKLRLWAPERVKEFSGHFDKTLKRFYFDRELYKASYEEINGVPFEGRHSTVKE